MDINCPNGRMRFVKIKKWPGSYITLKSLHHFLSFLTMWRCMDQIQMCSHNVSERKKKENHEMQVRKWSGSIYNSYDVSLAWWSTYFLGCFPFLSTPWVTFPASLLLCNFPKVSPKLCSGRLTLLPRKSHGERRSLNPQVTLSCSWFRKTSLQFTLGRYLNCLTYGCILGNFECKAVCMNIL